MMKEIGSEFWNVPLSQNATANIPHNLSWYVSGRAALDVIIKDIKQHADFSKAALPSWCCDSMIKPFLENGVEVVFYPVFFEDGKLCRRLDEVLDADVLFVMDYFGFSRFDDAEFSGIKICDLTHSVFSERQQRADYYFGSLRKWAGFYTGGFAYSKIGELAFKPTGESPFSQLRKKAMLEKKQYIENQTDNKEFLKVFRSAEEWLDNNIEFSATIEDIKKAERLDIEFIKSKRRENAQVLIEQLNPLSLFLKLEPSDCPLFVPIIVPNGKRDALRNHLVEKNIYCPIHWPTSSHHQLTEQTQQLYNNELSIICDQRYDVEDMLHIIETIKKF